MDNTVHHLPYNTYEIRSCHRWEGFEWHQQMPMNFPFVKASALEFWGWTMANQLRINSNGGWSVETRENIFSFILAIKGSDGVALLSISPPEWRGTLVEVRIDLTNGSMMTEVDQVVAKISLWKWCVRVPKEKHISSLNFMSHIDEEDNKFITIRA